MDHKSRRDTTTCTMDAHLHMNVIFCKDHATTTSSVASKLQPKKTSKTVCKITNCVKMLLEYPLYKKVAKADVQPPKVIKFQLVIAEIVKKSVQNHNVVLVLKCA